MTHHQLRVGGWNVLNRIAAVALALAIGGIAAPALADVKAGVDAWARGDYRKAVAEWRGPAIAGDADAQFNLGQAYKLGRGVAVDLAMAEEWYRRAAVQGHPQASDNYGLALFQNNKRDQAAEWLEKSAARGEPRTQYVLGTMYFNGDVVKRDFVRAYALMTRASAAGIAQATTTLAQMDRYVSTADRQRGTELARRYETEAGRGVPVEAPPPAQPDKAPAMTADLPRGPQAAPVVPRARPTPRPLTLVTDPDTGFTPPSPATPPRAAARPAPRAETPPRAQTDGGWRVQLGTFRDAGNAKALFDTLRSKGAVPGLTPYMVPVGALTRLQAGPFASNAAASAACASIKRAGGECIATRK